LLAIVRLVSMNPGVILRWLVRWAMLPILSAALVLLAAYLLPSLVRIGGTAPLARQDAPEGFGLQDVILAVRQDLIAAQVSLIERGEEAMFDLKTFDVEISFVVRESASAEVKTGPQFVVVGSSSAYATEQVQRIKLTFESAEPPEVVVKVKDIDDLSGAVSLE
jgi:hypothetical protein